MDDKYHFIAEMAKEIEPQMEWTKEMSHAFWRHWLTNAPSRQLGSRYFSDPERMMKEFKQDWLFRNQINKIINE